MAFVLWFSVMFYFSTISYGQFNQGNAYRPYYYYYYYYYYHPINRTLNIGTALQMHGHTPFYNLIRRARMYSVLYQRGPFTVFTPNVIDNSTKNKIKTLGKLRLYLEYHIFKGKFECNNLQDGKILKSFDQHNAIINKAYDIITMTTKMWIQGIQVKRKSLKTGNGIIYVLDGLMEKPEYSVFEYLEKSQNYKIIMRLLNKYRLYFQFPYGTTFLAPIDHAFEKLPTKYKEENIF